MTLTPLSGNPGGDLVPIPSERAVPASASRTHSGGGVGAVIAFVWLRVYMQNEGVDGALSAHAGGHRQVAFDLGRGNVMALTSTAATETQNRELPEVADPTQVAPKDARELSR